MEDDNIISYFEKLGNPGELNFLFGNPLTRSGRTPYKYFDNLFTPVEESGLNRIITEGHMVEWTKTTDS